MAAVDRNRTRTPGDTQFAPYNHAEVVTPSDTVDLVNTGSAIYVGGTGAVAVITVGGETVTFSAVPVGTVLPVRVTRVKSTGTTATLMVALS